MSKKGDAGIVSVVLLIIAAIAVAVLVTTFSKQTEEKVSERIVSLGTSIDCEDIRLSVENFENGLITVKNRGTLSSSGVFTRAFASDISQGVIPSERTFTNCPADVTKDGNLLPQQECTLSIDSAGTVYRIEIIPVIPLDEGELACENKISIWEP